MATTYRFLGPGLQAIPKCNKGQSLEPHLTRVDCLKIGRQLFAMAAGR